MRNNIPEATFYRLSRLITDQLGLSFSKERFADLNRGMNSVARAFDFTDVEACITWLLSSTLSRRQTEVLASHLTVGETYFFRDTPLFKVMEEEIFPGIVSRCSAGDRHLRIWSAGCASGEEAYSIAIVLHKLIPDIKDWNITILATDINPDFLKKAENGVYRDWSFRETPAWIRENYFAKDKNAHYRIVPWIRKMVSFSYLNLAEDAYPSLTTNTNAMDMIFCRNVLMYFEPVYARSVIQKLHNSLVDGGWLIVSPCDVPHDALSPFVTVHYPGAILYRKDRVCNRRAECPDFEERGEQRLNIDFSFPEMQPEPDSTIHPLIAVPDSPEPEPQTNGQARELYEQGLFTAASALLIEPASEGGDFTAMTLLARTLANQGKLAEAEAWCEKAIALDKFNPGLHYLLGVICYELGRTDAAVKSLKRSLYLDPDFILAYFTLANIYRSAARIRESNKNYQNALALLNAMPPDQLIPESEGIYAGRLKEIINATCLENDNG